MKSHVPLLFLAGLACLAPDLEAQTVTVIPFATPRALSRDGVAATGWLSPAPFLWRKGMDIAGLTGSVYNQRAVCDLGAVVAGLVDDPFTGLYSSGFWSATTSEWTSLGSFPGVGGCPGYGEAYALSSDGSKVAGELFLNCDLTPFTWTQAGGYNVLPLTGGFGHVGALSGDGVWAGGWDTHPTLGFRRGALWNAANEESFPLVSPSNPNGSGEITAMNDDGSVYAGYDQNNGAFVNRNGSFTFIPVPNNNSLPTGVSNDGTVVVGSWGSPFTGKTSWVWTESGGAKQANEYFFGEGVPMPAGELLTEMMGVSRDGRTFLARYEGAGANPNGAIIVELAAPDIWADLGGGTTGFNGVPTLLASGPLTAGSDLTIDLAQAPTNALMLFRASLSSTPVNAVGGTLHANPFDLQLPLFADASGEFSLTSAVAAGAPSGQDIYFQFIVQDGSSIFGITLSNAVTAATP
jgi:hypothetical protein